MIIILCTTIIAYHCKYFVIILLINKNNNDLYSFYIRNLMATSNEVAVEKSPTFLFNILCYRSNALL